MNTKKKKIESLLRQEIPVIIQQDLRDPRLGFITVTDIDLASDYRSATVYFSALTRDGEEETDTRINMFERVLNHCAPQVQKVIADTLELRYTPVLTFKFSDSLRKSVEITNLIKKARESDIDHIKENPDEK